MTKHLPYFMYIEENGAMTVVCQESVVALEPISKLELLAVKSSMTSAKGMTLLNSSVHVLIA